MVLADLSFARGDDDVHSVHLVSLEAALVHVFLLQVGWVLVDQLLTVDAVLKHEHINMFRAGAAVFN